VRCVRGAEKRDAWKKAGESRTQPGDQGQLRRTGWGPNICHCQPQVAWTPQLALARPPPAPSYCGQGGTHHSPRPPPPRSRHRGLTSSASSHSLGASSAATGRCMPRACRRGSRPPPAASSASLPAATRAWVLMCSVGSAGAAARAKSRTAARAAAAAGSSSAATVPAGSGRHSGVGRASAVGAELGSEAGRGACCWRRWAARAESNSWPAQWCPTGWGGGEGKRGGGGREGGFKVKEGRSGAARRSALSLNTPAWAASGQAKGPRAPARPAPCLTSARKGSAVTSGPSTAFAMAAAAAAASLTPPAAATRNRRSSGSALLLASAAASCDGASCAPVRQLLPPPAAVPASGPRPACCCCCRCCRCCRCCCCQPAARPGLALCSASHSDRPAATCRTSPGRSRAPLPSAAVRGSFPGTARPRARSFCLIKCATIVRSMLGCTSGPRQGWLPDSAARRAATWGRRGTGRCVGVGEQSATVGGRVRSAQRSHMAAILGDQMGGPKPISHPTCLPLVWLRSAVCSTAAARAASWPPGPSHRSAPHTLQAGSRG
jgi:hypothetical protein